MWTVKFSLFIILIIVTVPLTVAEDGGYEISPHDKSIEGRDDVDTSGADGTYNSFWDLPLRMQIAYVSGFVLSFVGIVKFLPFLLSVVKELFDNNENRNKVYNYIVKHPGCTIKDLSDGVGINRGSTKYHIKTLERNDKIETIKSGKYTLLIQNSATFNEIDRKIIPHLKSTTSKDLLISILNYPGITNTELSEMHYLSKSTVNWYITKFQNDDIIIAKQTGKYKKYYLNHYIKQIVPDNLIKSL
ncbi:conserved hypothetical protein [Methanohalobium evestigatum Z-7303]|uniref:Transcriptional regulator, ArsR family n=1 Tax=Methanohalobium evestigatum (strain ATCC BAA-1072 / DSM 3721 / NBRC 107634 / OCM 161 / Z-7303) TaxID=644295 RepID=D7E929_METEZ|nr:conserved hypothetical protein [Methanohalobium evestigatum Z-7303]